MKCEKCETTANHYVSVVYGGEDHTSYRDLYLCDNHTPDDVGSWSVQEVIWADAWNRMADRYQSFIPHGNEVLEITVERLGRG